MVNISPGAATAAPNGAAIVNATATHAVNAARNPLRKPLRNRLRNSRAIRGCCVPYAIMMILPSLHCQICGAASSVAAPHACAIEHGTAAIGAKAGRGGVVGRPKESRNVDTG